MAKDVVMPVLGMSQDSGVLLKWLKQPGDAVTKGDILMEVETDKAVVEVEAQASGTLAQVSAAEGEEIPTGQVIAVILGEGESAEEAAGADEAPAEQSSADAAPTAAPTTAPTTILQDDPASPPASAAAPQGSTASSAAPSAVINPVINDDGKVLASPKAKRLAREHGVALAYVAGRGPGSAVLAQDVLDYEPPAADEALGEGVAADAVAAQTAAAQTDAADTASTAERAAAAATASSPATSVLQSDVDVTALGTFVARLNERSSHPLTLSDVLVKFVAVALRKHTALNPEPERIDVMLATPDGVKVALLQADRLSIVEIAKQRLEPPPSPPSTTFTLYALQDTRADRVSAPLPANQHAALAVGRISPRVVPEAGETVVRDYLTLTLSVRDDLDLADASAFLDSLVALCHDPMDMVVAF
ncbi:MAG: biotin/lipoyl-containing protein [Trueperaceae bacterium]|nr:biotin/lipoyl-containing protein [Trueperaceae bacterium]